MLTTTLTAAFKAFLKTKELSPSTQRNYLSDRRYFLRWVEQSIPQFSSEVKTWFNQTSLQAFKEDLLQAQVPPATINRRLSSLRQFGDFLISQGWLEKNPALKVRNTKQATRNTRNWKNVLKQFKQALKDQGQSKTTIKNYASDVRQYLEWASVLVAGNLKNWPNYRDDKSYRRNILRL